jgi:hypothetical protein
MQSEIKLKEILKKNEIGRNKKKFKRQGPNSKCANIKGPMCKCENYK